ncbi:hypothetical protein DUNSADRAFT_7838 [Dunaliella salina]|uniref:Uncharacterized protein n=1 Tax=Dunaliella salina TaxID=3046 RepID=A0ABQ7FT30_DUNSA|nr:hypothetical protein DUNSADRAFT_7838 [Dunaliella salina]|eukprot:KAF5825651.1 hypothetical protein DUNSADRAFT_7838 [Dunaliella salina]
MDVDNDMQELPPSSPMDIALMRLIAGKSTLRLALRHDARMTNSTFCMLSLMMQDPVLEVRAEFAKALLPHVTVLMAQGMRPHTQQSGVPTMSAGGWVPSKYAAMLPLAGM